MDSMQHNRYNKLLKILVLIVDVADYPTFILLSKTLGLLYAWSRHIMISTITVTQSTKASHPKIRVSVTELYIYIYIG